MAVPETHRPIVRHKLYELVAERVLEDVSRGVIKPGDPLPVERTLAEQYGVGRSSIREALRMLESGGVIEAVGRGAFVVARNRSPLNQPLALLLAMRDGDMRELYEVRRILEVEMAALAAKRRTDDDIDQLRVGLDEMTQGLGSRERYIGGDLRFHLTVVSAARNRIAAHVMRAIRDVIRRALMSVYDIPGSPERSMAEHRRIFEAIVAGAPEEARERMKEHLERVETEVEVTVGLLEGTLEARLGKDPA
jgi:GntR family transcriptional regulator, transcriptional repressor for pyruvate dehydrogenase complex